MEEKPAAPAPRVRGGAAIIQAIDKVTAETLKFEAPVGQPIRYKTLIITVRACETTAADEEQPDSAAYLKSIDAAADDLHVHNIPNCGKGTPMQSMMVGNGGPHTRGKAIVTGAHAEGRGSL